MLTIKSFYYEKNKKTFQKELVALLEKRGIKEFKGQSLDEILLQTVKPMLKKLLNAEIDDHLGYKKMELAMLKIQGMNHLGKQ